MNNFKTKSIPTDFTWATLMQTARSRRQTCRAGSWACNWVRVSL